MLRRSEPNKRRRFLSSSEVWSRVGGHQVRGRRHSVPPAGGSAEGGGRETSRDEFSEHRGQRVSSWYPPWRTSGPASLLCTPSLLPLKERERQEDTRPLQNKVPKVTNKSVCIEQRSRGVISGVQK